MQSLKQPNKKKKHFFYYLCSIIRINSKVHEWIVLKTLQFFVSLFKRMSYGSNAVVNKSDYLMHSASTFKMNIQT